VAAERKRPDDDLRTPVERTVSRSFIDPETGKGQPLSRRTRQTRRTVESYLKAGVVPRYMERLREIETGLRTERQRLERAYRALLEEHGHDREAFAQRWRARVESLRHDALNELIREHNDWYPIEANLPMDPRTRDYVLIRGRSYRRPELTPERILREFPPLPDRMRRAS
jgi:hypothetical protein